LLTETEVRKHTKL